MGREIKRVPLDFDWPINKTWEGYINPHYADRRGCPFCDGSGYNPETKRISDSWYPDHDYIYMGRKPRWEAWRENLTQEDVDVLVEENCLRDLTHIFDRNAEGSARWKQRPNLGNPTAEEVNKLMSDPRASFFLMGGSARYILTKHRAEKAGVYGLCPKCEGSGDIWLTPESEKLAEEWAPTEVPKGPGWQYWENVSEGSPQSPVFEKPDDLAKWLVDNGESSSLEAARKFLKVGWGPSAIMGETNSGETVMLTKADTALATSDAEESTVDENRFGMLDTTDGG